MILFNPNIVLDALKKPKKYITSDELVPPPPLTQPVEVEFGCENRPVIPYVMIIIIVGTKIIRFLVDDSNYLDYMIYKLSTETPQIANY